MNKQQAEELAREVRIAFPLERVRVKEFCEETEVAYWVILDNGSYAELGEANYYGSAFSNPAQFSAFMRFMGKYSWIQK